MQQNVNLHLVEVRSKNEADVGQKEVLGMYRLRVGNRIAHPMLHSSLKQTLRLDFYYVRPIQYFESDTVLKCEMQQKTLLLPIQILNLQLQVREVYFRRIRAKEGVLAT